MAEGFARTYGSDVLQALSAGLAPAMSVAPLTHKVMLEKNIDVGNIYPKDFKSVAANADLIINMSGMELPMKPAVPVEKWEVRDPIGESEEIYREVRDQIELQVMQLILVLRARKKTKPSTRSKVDTRRHSLGQ
jgi:arsenate reductase (thioredoxin)